MTTPRAFGYARTSTPDQVLGLQAQVEAIRRYADYKNLDLVEILSEHESAALTFQEREVASSLDARLCPGDHLVIAKLDRAFRSTRDCLECMERWESLGITLHITDFPVQDLSNAHAKVFLTMVAAFAELERNMISERTKAGLAQAKRRGKKLGNAHFGAGETEKETLRHLLSYWHEGFDYSEIARRLNELGLFPRKAGAWTRQLVRFQVVKHHGKTRWLRWSDAKMRKCRETLGLKGLVRGGPS